MTLSAIRKYRTRREVRGCERGAEVIVLPVVVGEGSPEKQSLSRALQKGQGGSHAETWKSLPEGTEGLRGRLKEHEASVTRTEPGRKQRQNPSPVLTGPPLTQHPGPLPGGRAKATGGHRMRQGIPFVFCVFLPC